MEKTGAGHFFWRMQRRQALRQERPFRLMQPEMAMHRQNGDVPNGMK